MHTFTYSLATAKQNSQQLTTVTLRLDLTFYKMVNAPKFTTIDNFKFQQKHKLYFISCFKLRSIKLIKRFYVVIKKLRNKQFVQTLQISY